MLNRTQKFFHKKNKNMKNIFTYLLICCFTLFSLGLTAQGVFPDDTGIYRLQNCATNEYLTAGNPPTMSTATDVTTEWQIIQVSPGVYNIDGQVTGTGRGVLRATSSNTPIIGTNLAPPQTGGDKTWTITYDAGTDSYTFTHVNGTNRDLTIGTGGDVVVNNSDDAASQWKVVSAVLPLDFVGFKAQNTKTGTQLNWEVDNVVNNSHFEILKGNNPDEFQSIGRLEEVNGQKHYQFLDRQITNQTVYYKLKQVDLDGKFSFSKIVSVKSSLDFEPLVIYPNPVGQSETFTIESEQGYQIFNSKGMLLKSGTEKTIKMDLEKGVYFIKQNDSSEVKRFIVF